MNEVKYHKRVARYLDKLPGKIKNKVVADINEMVKDPEGQVGSINIGGDWAGIRRFKVGQLRVIYVHQQEKTGILIAYVGPRGDVYRKRRGCLLVISSN
tara:strand:+ start:17 stop:313 length:297 start_codon:yes stop_codon:yes gene_type:complete